MLLDDARLAGLPAGVPVRVLRRRGANRGGKATNHEVSGSGHMIVHCVKARQIFAPRCSGDAVSRFVT